MKKDDGRVDMSRLQTAEVVHWQNDINSFTMLLFQVYNGVSQVLSIVCQLAT